MREYIRLRSQSAADACLKQVCRERHADTRWNGVSKSTSGPPPHKEGGRLAAHFWFRTMKTRHSTTASKEQPETGIPPRLRSQPSVGARWRFRRNLAIYVAHRGGISQRILADVFDLPRSRISSIIKDFQSSM